MCLIVLGKKLTVTVSRRKTNTITSFFWPCVSQFVRRHPYCSARLFESNWSLNHFLFHLWIAIRVYVCGFYLSVSFNSVELLIFINGNRNIILNELFDCPISKLLILFLFYSGTCGPHKTHSSCRLMSNLSHRLKLSVDIYCKSYGRMDFFLEY